MKKPLSAYCSIASVLIASATGIAYHHNANAALSLYKESNKQILNPERGIYLHPGPCSNQWDATKIENDSKIKADPQTNDSMNLVMCIFYLDKNNLGTDAAINNDIATLSHQMEILRSIGAKMILRFAYFECNHDQHIARPADCTASRKETDRDMATIRRHLTLLRNVISQNQDTIAFMEAGFIGQWGEWDKRTSTISWNIRPDGSSDMNDARSEIVRTLQSFLPQRMVSVRTPSYKAALTNVVPNRVGYHIDCFLQNATHGGTYSNVEVERPLVREDTFLVPMGGETCLDSTPAGSPPAPIPYDARCSWAEVELGYFHHFTYLNGVREKRLIDYWKADLSEQCWPKIKMLLGHRLTIDQSTFPESVQNGSTLNGSILVANVGWGALTNNQRPVYLVMRNIVAPFNEVRLQVSQTTGKWKVNYRLPITVSVPINGVPIGEYKLFLSMPDPSPRLAGDPRYAIRMASTDMSNIDVWEKVWNQPTQTFIPTGLNKLSHTVRVTAATPVSLASPFGQVISPQNEAVK